MSVAGVINGLTLGGTTGIVDGIQSSHPSLSGESVIATYSIPGGTFKEGDILQIQSAFLRRSTATSPTLQVKISWNQTPDLTTPVLLAQNASGTLGEYLPIMRSIAITATSSLIYASVITADTDFGDADGNELSQAIETITSIDWSIDGYFVISMIGGFGTVTGEKYYFTVII
jgi:hypothetical protein